MYISGINLQTYLKKKDEQYYMEKEAYDMGARGITVMKLVYGTDIAAHCHDFFEIQYIESGSCIQCINGETVYLKAGDICLFNKETSHSIKRTDEEVTILHIGLDEKLLI